jgi:DNA-binding transcriptional ArsR family regulator
LTPSRRRAAPRLPRREAYTLEDLDQVKVLADPLRLRILEAFGEERTTKQVADLLGEPPTKLYHHVEALERVGLVELARTRQNRGTVEKYYLAVARSFRADSRLFQPAARARGRKGSALRQMVSTIFDTTAAELAALAERGEDAGGATGAVEKEAVVSFLEIRASRVELEKVRAKLRKLVESLATTTEGAAGSAGDPGQERYRLTLAYYPLDEPAPPRRRKR